MTEPLSLAAILDVARAYNDGELTWEQVENLAATQADMIDRHPSDRNPR